MSMLLVKPTINGDRDTWGQKINENIDKLNVLDNTIESVLGVDYEGNFATTGSFSLFNNNIVIDLDDDTVTFNASIDTPTIENPTINGEITGTSVSSNGTDNTLVKYGIDGLITCGIAGIFTNKIENAGTLDIDGEITGTSVSSTGVDNKLVKYGVNGLITCGVGGITTNTINNAGTLTIDGEIIGTSVSNSSSANKVVKYDVNGDINSTNINTNQIDLISGTELTINSNTNVVGTFTVNGDAVENNILKENITMEVGSDKEFTHLHYALEEASKYSVGYFPSDPTIQYRITIQIDDGYDMDALGIIKDLYLPHVDICSGTITISNSITGHYGMFENCTFGSINMSFTGGGAQLFALLSFTSCKIERLLLSFIGTPKELLLGNTNIFLLSANNLRISMDCCIINGCTGDFPEVIHMSNIIIDHSISTIKSFTIESSIVRIEDSSISSTGSNTITNSNVYLEGSTISSSSSGLLLYSSNVEVSGGAISGYSNIILARNNSNIAIYNECSLTDMEASWRSIASLSGSKVTINTRNGLFNITILEESRVNTLHCSNAEIMLESSDSLSILDNGTDPSIVVINGGKISLINVTGTKNITENTLTAKGIIFSN